jgi:hypothetical protein
MLLSLTFLLIYLTDHYILTINFYENSGDPVAEVPAQESVVYESLQKWIYLASAFYLLIKLFFISLVLYTAFYLSNHPVPFGKVFNVAVLADFIFLIPAVSKFFWFQYKYPEGTLADWHRVYILSALSLFDSAPADWYYALQTLNVFEVAYWFSLAYGIYKISSLDYDRSLKLVVCSYVPALFIWVATVTFCTLVMFPSTG